MSNNTSHRRRNSSNVIIGTATIFVLLLSGCCWLLPEGEPPQGNILENPRGNNDKVYTAREALDYMVSALTLAMLERCPGAKIVLTASDDDTADAVALWALRESGKITGNQAVKDGSDWELRPELTGNKLTLTLFCQGQAVWRETVNYQAN